MQTLVPIGSFEEKARELLNEREFDAMLDLLASDISLADLFQGRSGNAHNKAEAAAQETGA